MVKDGKEQEVIYSTEKTAFILMRKNHIIRCLLATNSPIQMTKSSLLIVIPILILVFRGF